MHNKELIKRCLAGEELSQIPMSFSKHFPADFAYGRIGVENHAEFFTKSGVNIVKIMNEFLMPYIGEIREPADWLQVEKLGPDEHFVSLLADFTRQIQEKLGEEEYYLLTVHGLIACTIHISLRQLGFYDARKTHYEHCLAEPETMARVHEHLVLLLSAILEQAQALGVDAIYYSSLGGDDLYFSDPEFAKFIAPYEIRLLQRAQELGFDVFLHMCKDHLQIKRYLDYAPYVDVVNWGVYENELSLAEGAKIFSGKTILGGLDNRDEDLLAGNEAKLREKVRTIVGELGHDTKFILGADCTMPTELPDENLQIIASELRALAK